jgi:hypothetical protein
MAITEEPPLLVLMVLANQFPEYVTLPLFCSMRLVVPVEVEGVEVGGGVDVAGGVDVGGGVDVAGGVVEPVPPVFVLPELPRSIMYASPYSVG